MNLKPRHERLIPHLAEGLSYRQVAERTDLSARTVRHYTNEIADQLPEDEYGDLPPKAAVMRWALASEVTV